MNGLRQTCVLSFCNLHAPIVIFHSAAHDNKRPSPAPEDFSSTDKGCGLGVTSEAVDVVSGETLQVTVSLPTFELLRDILRDMWRYCHAYHINNSVSKGDKGSE